MFQDTCQRYIFAIAQKVFGQVGFVLRVVVRFCLGCDIQKGDQE